MARVTWRDGTGMPVCSNMRSLPKKPVIWWGSAYLVLPGGGTAECTWRSQGKMTVQQAQDALRAVVLDLVDEHRETGAVDAGFYMECR